LLQEAKKAGKKATEIKKTPKKKKKKTPKQTCEKGSGQLATTTFLYAEDRGLQVPMTLEHGNIVGTQCCDKTSRDS